MVLGKQLAFHIDSAHCAGCKTCQIACKDRANLEVGQLWRKVTLYEQGGWVLDGNAWRQNVSAFWVSMSCNHCENPLCVQACPTGAMYKREADGIVLVDQEKCVGCGYCAWSCPYNGPQMNPAVGKMGKCDFCLDRLQAGKRPVCVDACPFQLISYGYEEDLDKEGRTGTNWVNGMANPGLTQPNIRIKLPKAAVRSPLGKGEK